MKHVSRMYTRVNILKTLHLVIYFYLFLIQITSSALEKLQLNSTLLVGIYWYILFCSFYFFPRCAVYSNVYIIAPNTLVHHVPLEQMYQ